MSKQLVTEEALKQLIQERISSGNELDGDCKEVIINAVMWHEPDETGSNWDVHSARNLAGCEAVLNSIIIEFKKGYNLIEE